jgi:hypothetical protein
MVIEDPTGTIVTFENHQMKIAESQACPLFTALFTPPFLPRVDTAQLYRELLRCCGGG